MPFYMSGAHGEGTRVWCAPAGCTLARPTAVHKLTVATAVESGSNKNVTWSADPAVTDDFKAITKGVFPYLTFVNPTTGEEILAEVTGAGIAENGLSANVNLKRNLPAGAVAYYPAKLGGRASVDIQSEDETAPVENFDNDGWKDYVMTSLGQAVSTTGSYMALDAGYLNALRARLDFQQGGTGKVILIVALPAPNFCPDDKTYSSGMVLSGIANVSSAPITSGAQGVIEGNIDFQYCGPVSITFDEKPVATPLETTSTGGGTSPGDE